MGNQGIIGPKVKEDLFRESGDKRGEKKRLRGARCNGK